MKIVKIDKHIHDSNPAHNESWVLTVVVEDNTRYERKVWSLNNMDSRNTLRVLDNDTGKELCARNGEGAFHINAAKGVEWKEWDFEVELTSVKGCIQELHAYHQGTDYNINIVCYGSLISKIEVCGENKLAPYATVYEESCMTDHYSETSGDKPSDKLREIAFKVLDNLDEFIVLLEKEQVNWFPSFPEVSDV